MRAAMHCYRPRQWIALSELVIALIAIIRLSTLLNKPSSLMVLKLYPVLPHREFSIQMVDLDGKFGDEIWRQAQLF
jgi:hypothetical protein